LTNVCAIIGQPPIQKKPFKILGTSLCNTFSISLTFVPVISSTKFKVNNLC
jgi:hypothetical protein